MGCDIHFVVEMRRTQYDDDKDAYVPVEPSKWVGVFGMWKTPALASELTPIPKLGEPSLSWVSIFDRMPAMNQRNYDFFARLAGVRGEGPEPKGVPPDASELARLMVDNDGPDGHSHSWDTLEDFIRAWLLSLQDEVVASAVEKQLQGKDRDLILYLAGVWDWDELTNYRVVYWFDN